MIGLGFLRMKKPGMPDNSSCCCYSYHNMTCFHDWQLSSTITWGSTKHGVWRKRRKMANLVGERNWESWTSLVCLPF